MSNLDSFLQLSRPPPRPVCTSQEIHDRNSVFVATLFRASNEADALRAVNYLRKVTHASKPASHEIFAWRCMVLKHGKTGLGGPDDFELRSGNEDDGEKYGGGRVLKVMQAEGCIDAVVIVSRWYGGEMLGPVRFEHIETCAREVCHTFRVKDEMEECVASLGSLDDMLSLLRAELAELTRAKPGNGDAHKKPDYRALVDSQDVKKAKRLVTARENSIKSVKAAIRKAKDQDKGTAASS